MIDFVRCIFNHENIFVTKELKEIKRRMSRFCYVLKTLFFLTLDKRCFSLLLATQIKCCRV
jgi:hypothetical protein